MVSLLEQYETESQQTNDYSEELNPFRTGFIQASLNTAEKEDIFKSQKVQINLQDRNIDQFLKHDGQMAILSKPNKIRLYHSKNSTDENIDTNETISRIFLDQTGRHLLVATEKNELFYYSRQSKKLRPINKLKGNSVTAVGWNVNPLEKTTDSILVGTSKGLLFELSLNTSNEGLLSSSVDTYCKQIHNFGSDTRITGIEIIHQKKENNYSGPSIENIYDVLVATSSSTDTRLYEFIGSDAKNFSSNTASITSSNPSNIPIFTSIFTYYETKNLNEVANFHQLPADFGYSQLQIRNSPKTRKKMVAWMTGIGILLSELDPLILLKYAAANYQNEKEKRLIGESNHNIINYPQARGDHLNDSNDTPIGINLTDYHLAIFYRNQVKIMCLLDKEFVLNQKLDPKSIGGDVKGVWFDWKSGDFGSYTSQSILKYEPNKETRRLWKIYLDRNDFETAKVYCKDNPVKMNTVLTKQAEYLFNNKKYKESAECYALTQSSFEEICLKYLELGNFTALRTFLTKKLNTLDIQKEITQSTVVIVYIIEIFLNQLSDLENHSDEHDTLQKEFYEFLKDDKIKSCLKESKEAVYKVFASHGNMSDMVYFAQVMNDYPHIILHYIQEENYIKAIEALSKQNNKDVYYKYSPIFFEVLPKDIVDLWIRIGNLINPVKLLPALASCSLNEYQVNEAIRYLEHCVNRLNSVDNAIHNNLLTLYLQHKPEKLLEYVKVRKDEKKIYFDELMIARLCTERSHKYLNEACVYLYTRMRWYEEAVELALNVNVDLAREVANSVNSDYNEIYSDELKKVLWLRIARHVIEKENDINKAMSFLQDLTESIAIEDVLPYFPEFVTIDQFKDAIRTSLATYTEKINTLRDNIDQAAKSAQLIRRDIQSIRQKSITVNTNDICSKCRYRLMSRRFYVFPCNHKFHSDCLFQTSLPYLMPGKKKRIEELQKLLQDIQSVPAVQTTNQTGSGSNQSNPVSGVSNALNHFAKSTTKSYQQQTYSNEEIIRLKNELNELLAYECPWCGERILKSIDEPFIDPMNYESVYNSWL